MKETDYFGDLGVDGRMELPDKIGRESVGSEYGAGSRLL
jgi:hypothetical protein